MINKGMTLVEEPIYNKDVYEYMYMCLCGMEKGWEVRGVNGWERYVALHLLIIASQLQQ